LNYELTLEPVPGSRILTLRNNGTESRRLQQAFAVDVKAQFHSLQLHSNYADTGYEHHYLGRVFEMTENLCDVPDQITCRVQKCGLPWLSEPPNGVVEAGGMPADPPIHWLELPWTVLTNFNVAIVDMKPVVAILD
jgi:hypothetical protein